MAKKMVERECEYCKEKFLIAAHRLARPGGGKYCSQRCVWDHNTFTGVKGVVSKRKKKTKKVDDIVARIQAIVNAS